MGMTGHHSSEISGK